MSAPFVARPRLALGSLFSGIGGLELGLECALRDGGFDVDTVFQCEADPWCRGILARHWPSAVRYDDVRGVGAGNAPRVDLLCGGFPCQDVSCAGDGAGLAGERSGLWFEFARIVRELRPRIVVVENVAALASRGLDSVLGSLAACGYDAVWFPVRASNAGAPHRRERLFIVAWGVADSGRGSVQSSRDPGVVEEASRLAGARDDGGGADTRRSGEDGGEGSCPRRRPFPRMGGAVDGVPGRVDITAHRWPVGPDEVQPEDEPPRVTSKVPMRRQRLKALGNSVVPQVSYVVGCVVAEILKGIACEQGA